MSVPNILSSLNVVILFALGLFVLSRSPERTVNRLFAFSMLALMLREAGVFLYSFKPVFLNAAQWWIMPFAVGEALVPGSFLLFSLVFSKKDAEESLRGWLYILVFSFIMPVGILIYSFAFSRFIGTPLFADNVFIIPLQKAGQFFYIFYLICLVLVLANFEATLRASSMSKRWKIKFMILGFGAITAFLIFQASQTILYSSIQTTFFPAASAVIMLGLFLIVLAVVRNRLLNVDIFISRHAIYNTFTIIFAGSYLVLVALAVKGAQYFGMSKSTTTLSLFIFVALIGLAVILLTERLRIKLKVFIVRNFYRQKYDFRKQWIEVTEKLGTQMSSDLLHEALLDFIQSALNAKNLSIWLLDEKKGGYVTALSRGVDISKSKISIDSLLVKYFKKKRSILSMDSVLKEKDISKLYGENKEMFFESKAELCVPLISQDNLLGFITVGKTIGGEPYGYDDIALLSVMSGHVANHMMRIKLSEEILSAKETEAFHNLTSFFVHDIKNIHSMLSLMLKNAEEHIHDPQFQKDILLTIGSAVKKMDSVITRLSETPKNVELVLVETDLKGLIKEAVDKFKRMTLKDAGGNISIVEEFFDIPHVNIDREKIKSVIINLMLNAYQSFNGRAGEIEVALSRDSYHIILSVSDNGPGINDEFIRKYLFRPFKTTKKKGLGIGLYQCKKIIDAHKGRIEVESEIGKGTAFYIKLPIEE